MLVTYIYQSDEVEGVASPSESPTKGEKNVKAFSFWTLFELGTVQPRANLPGTPRSTPSGESGSRVASEY